MIFVVVADNLRNYSRDTTMCISEKWVAEHVRQSQYLLSILAVMINLLMPDGNKKVTHT